MWRFDRAFLVLPAVDYVAQHLATYQEFPPRQEPGSFNLNAVLETCGATQAPTKHNKGPAGMYRRGHFLLRGSPVWNLQQYFMRIA